MCLDYAMTWMLELTQDCYLMVAGCGIAKAIPWEPGPLPSHHWHYMRLSCLRFATRYHDTCNISRYTVWPTKVAMSSTEAIAGFHTILNPDFHFMAEIWCMAGVWYPTSDLKYVWKGLVNNEPSKPPVGKKTEHRLRKIASPIEDIPLADILSKWPSWPCNFSRLIFYQNPPKDAVFVISLSGTLFLLASPGERNFVNETTGQFLKEKHFNAKQMLEWQTPNPNQWCV